VAIITAVNVTVSYISMLLCNCALAWAVDTISFHFQKCWWSGDHESWPV